MGGAAVPFLWLCGPSGVGKSAVGWEIFAQLTGAGVKAGYVDADQLGLCYPAPAGDPGNDEVKARNLGAVWPVFRAAGVRCMVGSGGLHTADTLRRYADHVMGAALTVCRLRVGEQEHRDRFRRRGWLVHLVDDAVREAAELDGTDFADLCVDTDGLPVAEVARRVRDTAGWPGPGGAAGSPALPPAPGPAGGPVPVLWITGPPCVGKSTVGWDVFGAVQRAGVTAAYVDLAQVGFCRPAPADDPENHRLEAGNVAAMWPGFASAGARCLIVSGGVTDPAIVRRFAAAMPAAVITMCRLRAGPGELTRRTLLRGQGGGPAIPGDELKGRPAAVLDRVAADAARIAEQLDAALGGVCVDTDGRPPGTVADLVLAATGGWPHLAS